MPNIFSLFSFNKFSHFVCLLFNIAHPQQKNLRPFRTGLSNLCPRRAGCKQQDKAANSLPIRSQIKDNADVGHSYKKANNSIKGKGTQESISFFSEIDLTKRKILMNVSYIRVHLTHLSYFQIKKKPGKQTNKKTKTTKTKRNMPFCFFFSNFLKSCTSTVYVHVHIFRNSYLFSYYFDCLLETIDTLLYISRNLFPILLC